MIQTIRFLGLTALLFSLAACGGGDDKKLTQKERWQKMGFEAGLTKTASQ
ncbi:MULTISPECIES: hypothetical protein [Nguyenibacter]|uniref:Uncharacterized protein n=1 Tax=Nguyenibacter vanlangensis TaxID=1216886 RepID=A0A7Y7IZA1_9PROT|nr:MULTISPECIES: hypothetical protein [Nguyenibacter]NVN12631.1 hypothetical protein [Nguyenibacter vanlangensis]WRH87175.1 hypothetical protein QN315_14485 [Nguyenibacter sp. L1]